MSNIAIKVENLSKRYRIGLKEELPETFVGAITAWLKAPFQNFRDLRRLTTFDEIVDFSGVEEFADMSKIISYQRKKKNGGVQLR